MKVPLFAHDVVLIVAPAERKRIGGLHLPPQLIAGLGRIQPKKVPLAREETEECVLVIGVELHTQGRTNGPVGDEVLIDIGDQDRLLLGVAAATQLLHEAAI
ncbi:MAG: hypothetical protein KY453_08725, partial [Gemmatimonadetes bacterium]|nr:hypothetical protein [Gemmatimonadota bacterium]